MQKNLKKILNPLAELLQKKLTSIKGSRLEQLVEMIKYSHL